MIIITCICKGTLKCQNLAVNLAGKLLANSELSKQCQVKYIVLSVLNIAALLTGLRRLKLAPFDLSIMI